jgi:hypothetical protein
MLSKAKYKSKANREQKVKKEAVCSGANATITEFGPSDRLGQFSGYSPLLIY